MALLHDEVEIVGMTGRPVIFGYTAQEVIQSVVPQSSNLGIPNTWLNRSNLTPNAALLHAESNPASNLNFGYWSPGTTRYLGIRVRTQATASWSYGWVGLQTSNFSQQAVTLTILDYALEQTVLSNRAAAAAPWQLYPNPAERTVELRGAPVGSRVQVIDALGRLRLSEQTNAAGQLVLDLAPLPAGGYVLRLNSAQGVVSRRFVKH